MFAIPTLGGVRMSAYSTGGGIWDSPNRAEVFRRPPRWIRGPAGAGRVEGVIFLATNCIINVQLHLNK